MARRRTCPNVQHNAHTATNAVGGQREGLRAVQVPAALSCRVFGAGVRVEFGDGVLERILRSPFGSFGQEVPPTGGAKARARRQATESCNEWIGDEHMSRVLQVGDSGPDVGLLQRDLNVWYEYWGAPARELLDRDGDLGEKTELAFRRARARLGLAAHEKSGLVQMTVRDRLIVRHLGRFMAAKRAGKDYEIPASVKRTPEEIARGKEAQEFEKRLRARFKKMRDEDHDLRPEITVNVPNQGTRHGLKPRIIVLHTTEGHNRPGLSDLNGLVSFFNNPQSQVSSHIANDAEGNDARMVPDEAKAFTQAAFNSISLSIEQIGFASQTEFPDAQLENTARWIAHWSRRHGIPIRRSTTSGVCQHSDLGAQGGGHHDCGPNYPLDRVLAMARHMS
jgi:hypothetical protein